MCPPFALVTALILLVIEFMRALIRLMGMLFHSSTRALVNLVAGGGWQCRTCLSNWSHRCSIGDKSGHMSANRVVVQQHNLTLQQDNARPHVARICQVFLANNNVQPLDWPPYSPDLSPIEHLWDQLDRQVRQVRPSACLSFGFFVISLLIHLFIFFIFFFIPYIGSLDKCLTTAFNALIQYDDSFTEAATAPNHAL